MVREARTLLSHQEYFALEQATGERHEYIAGAVVMIAPSSSAHSTIAVNAASLCATQLWQQPNRLYNCGVRIAIPSLDVYTYADLSIVADTPIADAAGENLVNPLVIVEVSSPQSANYDRMEKFLRYHHIATLQDYVLIAEDFPLVQRFSRCDNGTWLWQGSDELTGSVSVPSIGCTLPLAEVYAKVEFAQVTD
jgi:Uma2 family endonuclease